MTVTVPSPATLVDTLVDIVAAQPVLLLVVVLVVWPAVWSSRPERRCAAAGVLAKLVDGVVAVAQLGVAVVLAVHPGRPAPA
ncbi:MAG: hypothetical protein AB7G09_10920 [Pseudonocardia sp.]